MAIITIITDINNIDIVKYVIIGIIIYCRSSQTGIDILVCFAFLV